MCFIINNFLFLKFEKTADHLFDAAFHGQKDVISGQFLSLSFLILYYGGDYYHVCRCE